MLLTSLQDILFGSLRYNTLSMHVLIEVYGIQHFIVFMLLAHERWEWFTFYNWLLFVMILCILLI